MGPARSGEPWERRVRDISSTNATCGQGDVLCQVGCRGLPLPCSGGRPAIQLLNETGLLDAEVPLPHAAASDMGGAQRTCAVLAGIRIVGYTTPCIHE